MTDTFYTADFAFSARILGALFYYPPESEQTQALIAAFRQGEWQTQWPLAPEALTPLVPLFCAESKETIPEAWQRLFIGPWALPAPPWGSVWLDKESVLFGDSTLELRQWMRDNHITWEASQNEPEDHFGTLLMLAAWLVENQRYATCDELLAWHLLPWAGRFLEIFVAEARHPFWQAAGRLARLTLSDWQSRLLMPVAQKALSR